MVLTQERASLDMARVEPIHGQKGQALGTEPRPLAGLRIDFVGPILSRAFRHLGSVVIEQFDLLIF